jgi:ATP-dependent Clp protease ATP-binding subunit ClpC
VAETTPQELEACRRLLPAFPAVFEIVRIPELSERPALAVLDRVAENRLKHSKKGVEKGATDLIYRLFHRFLPYEGFPGKALAFLRDLCDEVVKASAPEVTKERALEMFVRRTGLPEVFLRDELPLPLEGVKESLEKDVRGQPAAIDAVARTVTAFKAGLADPRKPLGVLLFAGPTGVGKTALARALSRYCFGQGEKQDRLVRLDMSEYGGPGAVQSFLGEGSEDVPAWIRRVREQPFCVLLFDEIEKASDLVFDVLLSLLDEGRLTDKLGRLTHFTSAFVVMTTNLGATARSAPGFGETAAPSYEQEAMKFFRPEFFNRIDRVVTFHSLSRETVLDITRKELAELARREGFVRSGLELVWTESVVEWLAKVGFDALLGARPLQRAIETKVVTPLSLLLAANPKTQNTTVRLDFTEASGLSTTIGRKSRD